MAKVELESKELMSACLRKIPGLSKLKVVDAVWIWTEPHSLRLKIKLTIQKEVMNGAILQQASIIDFVIRNQQCKQCQAYYAQGMWTSVVQVRQHVPHKRTFYYLEQLLLKESAHADCLQIVTFKDGMDFYFMEKQQGLKFIDFLESHVPIKVKYSRKLLTADHKSNVGKFKHNHMVTIAPVCKDDLVLLPAALARNLSNISRIVLVKGIGSGIQVIDPFTGERQEINTEKYFRDEFGAVMTAKQLTTYVVLSVEPVLVDSRPSSKKRGLDRKMRVAECVVARERDFGVNDTQFTCLTHLGNILREGDFVQGYDLTTAPWANDELDGPKMKGDIPDLMLVRKYYAAKKNRMWDLKKMDADEYENQLSSRENQAEEADYELFMQELDADKEMRANVNLYKTKAAQRNAQKEREERMSDGESDDEDVRLDELLDGLELNEDRRKVDFEQGEILSSEAAASIPAVPLETQAFDEAQYNPKDFKFI
eukprot:CAMPEP_0185034032 /NCGR_PEP_ID=MMETSP1103-20130426/23525_1 /TAXON_ID=36769 /ORGANISM="Paraphysomonas bandaiensis, Strain Caron Lab Isolate" /LENGTH=481 /DNA_ID=CAMNT_0027570519 /DNA_START=220 /DNA_END=1666 /DNA_ORIENTATION=+